MQKKKQEQLQQISRGTATGRGELSGSLLHPSISSTWRPPQREGGSGSVSPTTHSRQPNPAAPRIGKVGASSLCVARLRVHEQAYGRRLTSLTYTVSRPLRFSSAHKLVVQYPCEVKVGDLFIDTRSVEITLP